MGIKYAPKAQPKQTLKIWILHRKFHDLNKVA